MNTLTDLFSLSLEDKWNLFFSSKLVCSLFICPNILIHVFYCEILSNKNFKEATSQNVTELPQHIFVLRRIKTCQLCFGLFCVLFFVKYKQMYFLFHAKHTMQKVLNVQNLEKTFRPRLELTTWSYFVKVYFVFWFLSLTRSVMEAWGRYCDDSVCTFPLGRPEPRERMKPKLLPLRCVSLSLWV